MEINNNGSVIMGVCHFCELHGPCVIFHTRLQMEESAKAASKNNQFPISSNTSCTACNPLGSDHPGFISSTSEVKGFTFSSDRCASEKARNRLQQTCFRSLSSEVSPIKESPLFFSDSGLGIHAISYTFFLKDSSARGFQRWFSLIALGPENAALVQLWSTLVPEMKELIGELQQMAAQVYLREEDQCSHRMLRSNLQHLASVGAARSLQDITGNPVVLTKLHTKLSRMVLLAYSSSRVSVPRQLTPIVQQQQPLLDEEGVLTLVRICQELGTHFKRYARHILKGGCTSVVTDDLYFKESCFNGLQLLVPMKAARNFILPQHSLQSASPHPYLMISDGGRKINCILIDNSESYTKVSCIVARLENILRAEEVSPSFIHQQVIVVREQLGVAAKKFHELKGATDQQRLLQFFQSFGYDCGDMDILQYWSSLNSD